MKIISPLYFILFFTAFTLSSPAQELYEYVAKKTDVPLTIDGKLTEPEWSEVALTELFVDSESGDNVSQNTRARMLWDDNYLYVGFLCEDQDVWSYITERDGNLWEEENVEIFLDPDGDKHNYIELEVSPLGTIFDQHLDRSWIEGSNNEDKIWNLEGMKVAVFVDGTLNEVGDQDSAWYCEIAIPFEEIASFATPLSSPPQAGDEWRIQLARYDRLRDTDGSLFEPDQAEPSIWNPTEQYSFHVPDKFGRLTFSAQSASSPSSDHSALVPAFSARLKGIYPNPLKSTCNIAFELAAPMRVKVEILNSRGAIIANLYEQNTQEGTYTICWDAGQLSPGMYFCRISTDAGAIVEKVLLLP